MKTRSHASVAIITWILLIFAVAVSVYYFSSTDSYVPASFSNARLESSVLAFELVTLLDSSVQSLDKISEEDKNKRFSSALDLVEAESKNVDAARTKAMELANKLEIMALSIQDIRPSKAKNLALEAVTKEVSLLNHLNNYNLYFIDLLKNLKMKFSGDINYDGDDVATSIFKMNSEANEINTINNAFNEKLREFDRSVK